MDLPTDLNVFLPVFGGYFGTSYRRLPHSHNHSSNKLLVHESLHAKLTDAANILTSNVTRSRMMAIQLCMLPGVSLLKRGLHRSFVHTKDGRM